MCCIPSAGQGNDKAHAADLPAFPRPCLPSESHCRLLLSIEVRARVIGAPLSPCRCRCVLLVSIDASSTPPPTADSSDGRITSPPQLQPRQGIWRSLPHIRTGRHARSAGCLRVFMLAGWGCRYKREGPHNLHWSSQLSAAMPTVANMEQFPSGTGALFATNMGHTHPWGMQGWRVAFIAGGCCCWAGAAAPMRLQAFSFGAHPTPVGSQVTMLCWFGGPSSSSLWPAGV